MAKITSPHNPRVKAAIRLRDARGRRKQGRLVIDGFREIVRGKGANIRLVDLFFCPARCPADRLADLETLLSQAGVEPLELSAAVFDKLAFGQRAEGVVATAEIPRRRLAEIQLGENPVVAVVEGIEKPGNVGAVLRSADATGIDLVIVADGQTDLYNPNAIRASLGTIFTVPVCEATTEETLTWLRDQDIAIVAALLDGATAYTDVDYCRGVAIALGSEADGLSRAWQADDVVAVRLPMLGAADSLNISATAAVLFYEVLRQRRSGSG